jgi:hypothetical protein
VVDDTNIRAPTNDSNPYELHVHNSKCTIYLLHIFQDIREGDVKDNLDTRESQNEQAK